MIINVTAIPGAKKPEVIKIDANEYKVKIDAPAQEGRANIRLIEILAAHFSVRKSQVKIIRGVRSRRKTVDLPCQ